MNEREKNKFIYDETMTMLWNCKTINDRMGKLVKTSWEKWEELRIFYDPMWISFQKF